MRSSVWGCFQVLISAKEELEDDCLLISPAAASGLFLSLVVGIIY